MDQEMLAYLFPESYKDDDDDI